MIDKKKLIKDVYDGIYRCARKRSIDRQQMQDFIQEGLVVACEIINKYPDKPHEELVKYIGKSAINKISFLQKKEINWRRRRLAKSVKVERPIDNWDLAAEFIPHEWIYNDDGFDIIDEREFVKVCESFLTDQGKRILKEKVSPSNKTVDIMEREIIEKNKRREQGELVMNVFTNKITDSHIAQSLSISKATVSRESGRIKEVVEYLKYGLSEQSKY